jgi:hypothetical protein
MGRHTDCVASFDNLAVGPKLALVRRLGSLPQVRESDIGRGPRVAFAY